MIERIAVARFLLPILLLACSAIPCAGQYWAKECTGPAVEHLVDVEVGPGDVVFSAGDHTAGATFDGQPLISFGLSDVFVAKQSATGNTAWVRRAGGSGLDLATRICAAANGDVLVCGSFSGQADLFGVDATSAGQTDFFVARLNGANGGLVWLRTGGGAAYADRATGLAEAPDGRILVIGEFRGTANLPGGTLTSVTDPGTGQPGVDVFLASLLADGTPQWVQHVSAPNNDAATAVACDGDGNAYLCGQFSGTITVDQVHVNTALNQVFVTKVDASGTEVWFRRVGGAALQRVADIAVHQTQVYLCGDAQGPLTWFDATPQTISDTRPNTYFLLKSGLDGNWSNGVLVGSINGVSAEELHVHDGTAAVYGSFQCHFAELGEFYNATGLFIANGPENLFIARHATSDLSILGAQQFGGHDAMAAGGLTALSNGQFVFGGTHDGSVIFPGDNNPWGESGPCAYSGCSGGTCPDPYYGMYKYLTGGGFSDGFVARGYVENRAPYDNWCRESCDRVPLDMVVWSLDQQVEADEWVVCGGDTLTWKRIVSRPQVPPGSCNTERTASFEASIQWNTGSTIDTIIVNNTGWYWCTITASNGCYTATDSIHITVLPAPSAWVDINGNNEPFLQGAAGATDLANCGPLSLAAYDMQPGVTYEWTVNGSAVTGTTVIADANGSYVLTATGPNGCSDANFINFTLLQNIPLPDVTSVDMQYSFNGVPLDVEDQIVYCGGGVCLEGNLSPTWYVGGQPTPLAQPYYVVYSTDMDCGQNQGYANSPLFWNIQVNNEGWYPLNTHMLLHVDGCMNDSLVFDFQDSVYVIPIVPPDLPPLDTLYTCIGDTLPLILNCAVCEEVEWFGPGIISVSADGDTALVTGFGNYGAVASNMGAGGLQCTDATNIVVMPALPPPIAQFPGNSFICPNDSALLWTTAEALSYMWTGPSGLVPFDNDSVWVSEFGVYYLSITTSTGCEIQNGPVFINELASPSLSVLPDNVICPGESAVLQLFGAAISTVVWNAPLFGNQLSQSVDSAGTYSCSVLSCGIPYALSADIISGYANATVDPGPYAICDGTTVLLEGPEGAFMYAWSPGGVATQDLLVSDTGSYQLQVTDTLGCTALSPMIHVGTSAFTQPMVAQGDTVCSGGAGTVSATGSGQFTWYADATLSQNIGTGGSLVFNDVQATITVYVVQAEEGCSGAAAMVQVVVVGGVDGLTILGDTSVCIGEEISLSAQASGNVSFAWSTPQGPFIGADVEITAATLADAGTYTCTATVPGCGGTSEGITVVVSSGPPAPTISGDVQLCLGDDLQLSISPVAGVTYMWTTPDGPIAGTSVTVNDVLLNDAGVYTCVPQGACVGAAAAVSVTVDQPVAPPVINGPDTLCDGEGGVLSIVDPDNGPYVWTRPDGSTYTSPSGLPLLGVGPGDAGVYVVSINGGGCLSASATWSLFVDACEVIIPNVFSPNGDGNNDVFHITPVSGTEWILTVYNRWGKEVYTERNDEIRWNGKDSGRDALADGVYFYELARLRYARYDTRTGYVQILGGR